MIDDHQMEVLGERFWMKVKKGPKCWEWCGASLQRSGYGQFRFINQRREVAHRVAWIMERGRIPDGKLVLHKCDNRKCVRPSHLELGDASKNSRDCHARGRRPASNKCGKLMWLSLDTAEIFKAYKAKLERFSKTRLSSSDVLDVAMKLYDRRVKKGY